MTLEFIIFIAAILFGILLYWRESNGNGLYRFINKVVNSKELQMDANNKKGFVYQQSFLLRLVYVTAFFLLLSLAVQFLTPFKIFSSYNGISTFASSIVGTIIGTYISSFVFKSGEVIEEKSDSIEDLVSDTIEKGKDFIEDLKEKGKETVDKVTDKLEDASDSIEEKIDDVKEDIKEDTESARERLKKKGLL